MSAREQSRKAPALESLLLAPYSLWAALFILVPLVFIAYYAFTDSNFNFTLENVTKFFTATSSVQNEAGVKSYIIAPEGLKVGDVITSSAEADIKVGNTLPLANIPVGTFIHNIELYPGKGAQLVRAAGVMAQLISKDGGVAQVRLPSGEVRIVRLDCKATIGQVGNFEHNTIKVGKAGKTRHKGFRPTVRGSVMNPCDHPHGGGEGRSPIGHPAPVTPWGKPALGYKTRNKKARTDKFIVKRRNAK